MLAKVYQIPDDKLRFRYFDSGSDIGAGASCIAVIAEAMNKFLTFALTIRFWRQETFDRNLLSFSNALDVAKKIDQCVADGVMPEQEGASCKARLFELAQKATQIGMGVSDRGRLQIQQKMLSGQAPRNLPEGESGDV